MEFPKVLEGSVDNHFSLVRPWDWYHERLCGHNKNRNKSKWEQHRKTSSQHLWSSLAHLEFRRVPLDGSNDARTDDKALVSGHGRAVVAVPDHWLRIWFTDYSDLTQWNQAAVKIPSKSLGGRSQQRENRRGRSKGCASSSGDSGAEVWPNLAFQNAELEKKKKPSLRDVTQR